VAATEPDRAVRLAADAERITRTYTAEGAQGKRASALANVSRVLVEVDPEHAEELAAEAERVAQAIAYPTPKSLQTGQAVNEHRKAREVSQVARALSSSDPSRAERIARSITDESQRDETLSVIIADSFLGETQGHVIAIAR
jgi:hypothetical protein